MSATKEVLPILLRSTTPVASEKVLIWHQRMQEEEPLPPERDEAQSEPDTTPVDPNAWKPEPFNGPTPIQTHAPVPRSESSPNSAKILEDLAASKSGVDYAGMGEVEEIESTIQEQPQSEAPSRRGSIVRSATHEPHPKHLSQDTVPSFGNLDANAFNKAPSVAGSAANGSTFNLQTPKIDVEAPSDPSGSHRAPSRHSRAPSRASGFRLESVRDDGDGDDTETVQADNDARTVPVETVAPSHKSRSVVSHQPSERGAPSVKVARSRASALSPPPMSVKSHHTMKSHHTAKTGSMHPSQMRLPSSIDGGSAVAPTPTQRTVPLQSYVQLQGSNYAPSHHAPSHHASSQHAPSKPPTVASRAPTAKEPSQHASSNHGNGIEATPSGEKRQISLHPLSNYPGAPPSFHGSQYGGGSKYAASNQGDPSRPLHPLTPHLQMRSGGSHHSYHIPPMDPQYTDDYIHNAVRGRAMAVSPTPSNPQGFPPPPITAPFAYANPHSYIHEYGMDMTGDERPMTPDQLTEEEKRILDQVYEEQLRTPRTSYTVTPTALAAEVSRTHFHDNDICVLLHAADSSDHELVRKVIRKAIKSRMKKLQMKMENEKLQYGSPGSYRQSIQDAHPPHLHAHEPPPPREDQPPAWAKDMMMLMQETRARLEDLERKKKSGRSYAPTESAFDNEGTVRAGQGRRTAASVTNDIEDASPITMTMPVNTPGRTGTVIEESVLQPGATEFAHDSEPQTVGPTPSELPQNTSEHIMTQEDYPEDYEGGLRLRESATPPVQDGAAKSVKGLNHLFPSERDDSPGQQYLAEEIYKLRVKPALSEHSHRTWEIQQDDEPGTHPLPTESEAMPEIPDTEESNSELPHYEVDRKPSPPLPALPADHRDSAVQGYGGEWPGQEAVSPPPWQRIHQRLLNWAIVWPMSELDQALNSTMRGHQVDEVALSIWSTQTYKRYVRARLTEHPPMRVDRLFIPPNVADAINSAVYNGRHGDACGMLRDMWTPFGLDGMPRLLLVLCKHRREENHWVAHRFSLPDGTLTTYDTYPERSLPDGRPLGWWFAIRIAWPHAMYPSPDHLAQRMVRIHRPMQLGVDNSVATAGIWRNLLMGSKAERSIDLERLRDLINTEVKNLRQRKDMGKLSITAPRHAWEDIGA